MALGVIALILAYVLWKGWVEVLRKRRAEHRKPKPDKGPPRWQRALSKGTPRMTFVIGAVLTLPGASYIAGIHAIHELHYSTAASIGLLLYFNLVMMLLLEIPLLCFTFAPDWTPGAIARAKAWVGERAYLLASRGLLIIGLLLILKGIIGLVDSRRPQRPHG